MRFAYKGLFLIGLLSVCWGLASAQVTTGTPPFGSFGGGPVDTINLANLNAHISIPVLNKPGRGLPFIYNLGYDSSVWYPVGSSGSQSWQPVQNFGWIAQTAGGAGYLTFTTTAGCYFSDCWYIVSGFVYHDPFGVPHSSNLEIAGTQYYNTVPYCGSTGGAYPLSCASADGSGYALKATSVSAFSAVDPSGSVTVPPYNTPTGTASKTDANGNEISISSAGVFTDTLGTTALTIAGSGTPSSPTTFTYTAPSGANAPYTMNYTNYTVATNFGVSGITEYKSSAAVPLVTSIVLPDGSQYTFNYETTPSTPASGACTPYAGTTCVTGRLTSVELPTEGTITYSYSGGNNGILPDGTTATLGRQTPDGTWSYAHTESGTAWTTTITSPLYNGQHNQTVMNFQGIYRTESQVYQGSSSGGTLLTTMYDCYNGAASPCNSTAVTLPITQLTQILQWAGSSGLQTKTVTDYDSHGNVTEMDEYAFGAGAPGSLLRKTLTTYASLSNGIVDSPSVVTVQDGSANVKAQTTFCYDEGTPSGTTTCAATGPPTATSGTPQHVSVTGSRGNVTTIAQLVSGSTTLGETRTYFDTGNVSVATDVNGALTTYTYGACGNSFATSVNEPLSLSKSIAWNCTGGVATSLTDENSKSVSTSYTDAYFWRPNSATDQLSYVTNVAYTGQTSVESSMNFNGSTSTADVLLSLDGLGRSHVSQVRQGQSSTTYDSTETDYDTLGRPDRATLPYPGTAGQTSSSAPSISTSYDALGRPTSVTDAGGGSTSYSYAQNDTYVTAGPNPTGENTKRRQFEYDAQGRLTSVCEVTSLTGSGTCAQTSPVTGYWTKYTYDVNNNLTGVTQNAQSSTMQTRTYLYDDLGRMTSEANPESGTATYTYDSDATCGTSKGDIVKRVDAVGNTVCYVHDALHRATKTTDSGTYASVTPSSYFVYDSATVNSVAMVNAKTRVAEAYTCFSPCSTKLTDEGFSYTARGEMSDAYQSTPHSGTYYHVTQSYWANGGANQLSGLSGLPTITYGVDGEGRLYSATASSGQNPLSSTTYNVASLPTAVNLGSSDSDSFSYDPNTNRMTQYKFTVNGQSVIGNLGWNPLGTPLSLGITDPFNSADAQTCSYSHDDLARIASDNCGSAWSQTFSFDAFGNINKSGTSSFAATYSAATNQMTEIGSSVPSYDSNGNVTNDFLHVYGWDANGRPITIDSVNVTYDALGRPVEQNRSGSYSEIAYTPTGSKLALMNGSSLQKGFVPLTGNSMAVYGSSGLDHYRHSDWLGSNRLCSSPSQTVTCDGAYGPYGETYAPSGSADPSFTGMNQDTVANLYDFAAREYGIQGRWPSPDPAGVAAVDPTDPQTWNRYAYVRNSPLDMFDPAGEDGCGLPVPGLGGWGPMCNGLMNGGLYGPSAGFGGISSLDLNTIPTPIAPQQVIVGWQVTGFTADGIVIVGGCGGVANCTNNETPVYAWVYSPVVLQNNIGQLIGGGTECQQNCYTPPATPPKGPPPAQCQNNCHQPPNTQRPPRCDVDACTPEQKAAWCKAVGAVGAGATKFGTFGSSTRAVVIYPLVLVPAAANAAAPVIIPMGGIAAMGAYTSDYASSYCSQ